MASIIFYTNPMSRGQIARWALHEAGADYEQVVLEYASSMKAADYMAINPMGKVPAIVHDGRVVTECAAICLYLADVFPAADLTPLASEKADYYRWTFFAAGPVEAAVTNRSMGWNPTEEQQRMAGYGHYDHVVATLAGHLDGRDYICGDRFTGADIYAGSQVIWGTEFGTLPKEPALVAYAERLKQRPAYQEAKAIDNQLIAAMQRGNAA